MSSTSPRGKYRENVYADRGGYMEIHAFCRARNEMVVGKFDKSDFAKIDLFSWTPHYAETTNSYYFEAFLKGRTKGIKIKIHRMLMQEPLNGYVVDHINHDTADNRKENLRVISFSQNCQNRKGPRKDNQLGVVGVRKRQDSYHARITVEGKQIFLGSFSNQDDAKNAVIEARAKYKPFSQEALA